MEKTIMDVSRWQGTIDWDEVKASGKVDGVMLRAMGNSKEGKPFSAAVSFDGDFNTVFVFPDVKNNHNSKRKKK